MQIQINTDSQVKNISSVRKWIVTTMGQILEGLDKHITSVEVFLSTSNHRISERETKCLIEARVRGKKPIAASCEAPSVDAAIKKTSKKVKRMLVASLEQRAI